MKDFKRKTKEFVCDKCGRDFAKKNQLRNHKADVHKPKVEYLEGQGHD